MAINTFEKTYNKIESKNLTENSGEILSQNKFHSLSLFTEDSISRSESRSSNNKIKKNAKSPYLSGDNVRLQTTKEKKCARKKAAKIASSFPLAVNIYKANSDEFKSQKRGSKKIKKSVLTLPNVPAITPQTCTVSDMNDSDYSNARDSNKQLRTKKRLQVQKGKTRVQNKDYVFYDRDARFCSQMNIGLNSSSTDMIKFTGDGNIVSNKSLFPTKRKDEKEFSAHDVWTVLRNINRFQFRPSPRISDDDSIKTPTKKKMKNKRKSNFRDSRVIETCRTEEFAYISSFDFESKSPPSFSHSSSFDRVTVIDKQDEISEICQKVEESVIKSNNIKGKARVKGNRTNRSITKNNVPVYSINTPKERDKELQTTLTVVKTEGQVDKEITVSPETEDRSKENTLHKKQVVNLTTSPTAAVKNELSKHGDKKKTDAVTEKFKKSALSSNTQYRSRKDSSAIKDDENIADKIQVQNDQNMKGITKVILSKGRSTTEPRRKDEHKRKPRLSTTVSRNEQQTTTNQDINNDHHVCEGLVLGERIRSHSPKQDCIFVKKSDTVQYVENGTTSPNSKDDLEIKLNLTTPLEKTKTLTKNKIDKSIENTNLRRRKNEFENNSEHVKNIRLGNNENTLNKKEIGKNPIPPSEINKIPSRQKNPKPVQQLRDTVLKLLYKKVSVKSLHDQVNENDNIGSKDVSVSFDKNKSFEKVYSKDIGTQTFSKATRATPQGLSKTVYYKEPPEIGKPSSYTKNSWAKGKWASEFIENVIRKIRNGIYYNQENICQYKTKPTNLNEVAVQTLLLGKNINRNGNLFVENKEVTADNNDFVQHSEFSERNNDKLPGFDQSLPALEIKTLNTKEVSLRHRTANVVIQFDIAHLLQSDYHKALTKSSSFIPVVKNENQTKILKFKTTLLNAVLPAELCSMIPTVLKIIIDSTKLPSLPAIKTHQNDQTLYTISELLRNENPITSNCEPVANKSSDLKKFFEGIYKYNLHSSDAIEINTKPKLELKYYNFKSILPNFCSIQHLFSPKARPIYFKLSKFSDLNCERSSCTCTALQLYKAPDSKVINTTATAGLKTCTVNDLLEHMWKQDLIVRLKIAMPLSVTFENCNNFVSVQINGIGGEKRYFNNIISVGLHSIFNRNIEKTNVKTEMKMIEYKTNSAVEKGDEKEIRNSLNSTKARRKSFVKLYKKCKSTSNISGEKHSIPLSKITNLDDFFKILGSARMISSIFDGNNGKKILTSISEMKNWVTEINSRQAMLILLLTNKKDTPNLVRFRPLLLQGIAVNRITRASELDMEIEVFERENFNRFSQYKGIPYTLEVSENSDNLLEELFWIAKTTASDYQKPFDESSEKLLKSLLEKRKRLNPSYLRVMARYVGLGLLKSPRKKLIC